MGERLHASHLLENFILFASLGLLISWNAPLRGAYFLIVACRRMKSNLFPKIVVLPDAAGEVLAKAGESAQRGPEIHRGGTSFFPRKGFRGPPAAEKYREGRKKSVDIFKLLIIIGASMIEARTSRVRLPKGQARGGRKGLPPRFRPSRPERDAKPGRAEKIPWTVTPPGVERCRGFSRFVCSA